MGTRTGKSWAASCPGQAAVELALGMFALALVLTALFAFTDCILASLDSQRDLRLRPGRSALNSIGDPGSYFSRKEDATVGLNSFAAEYIFGTSEVKMCDEVHIPAMGIGEETER